MLKTFKFIHALHPFEVSPRKKNRKRRKTKPLEDWTAERVKAWFDTFKVEIFRLMHKQNKTKQNTKQNKTKQNKTKEQKH